MSTGQIIGGVIGGVIGFFVGAPVQGAMIGASIGGALDPQKIDGPHLQDRKVQMSTYGAAIPIIYGGDAGSGNVIWSADLQEHDVESSGKGGPTVTQHTYTVSCAILIGEGPIAGIRKIWADAKLVYDVSAAGIEAESYGPSWLEDSPAQVASELFESYFTFYPGTEDQLPDPTMEAALGVGNVPAYLGSSYIVFTDLPVTPYGNRIPNFRFETSEEAAPVTPDDAITYEPLRVAGWNDDTPEDGNVTFTDSTGGTGFASSALAQAYLQANWGGDFTQRIGYYTTVNGLLDAFTGAGGSGADIDINDNGGAQYAYIAYNAVAPDVTVYDGASDGSTDQQYCYPLPCAVTGSTASYMVSSFPVQGGSSGPSNGHVGVGKMFLTDISGPLIDDSAFSRGIPGAAVGANCTSCTGGDYFPYAVVVKNQFYRVERTPVIPEDVAGCPVGDPCLLGEPAQVPGHPNFCIACDGTVTPSTSITYELISGTAKQLAAIEYRDGVLYQNGLGPVLLPSDPNYSNATYWADQAAAAIAAGTLQSDVSTPAIVSEYAKGTGVTVDRTIAGEANTTLDAIVSDLCDRPGLPSEALNVTALEGIPVQGYAIARQMPARAAILQTQQAFFWDFVESGRQLKAVLRGGDPVATIGLDDLGATESEEPIVAVVPTRAQEAEMPATLNLAYPVRKTGYETGTQRARRLTTTSKQTMSVEIAVVMEDQKAADVVGALMYAAWTNRVQRQWSTTRKWAHLEPTDVVTLDDGEFTYVVRITDRSEEGGVIKWKGVDEQPAAYHPISSPGSVTGTSGDGYSLSVRFDGPSRLELIDSAIVYEGNDDPGHYAGAAGYRTPWFGEVAYRSIDGGTTWVSTKTMTNTATMGHATSVLGGFDGGNVVDERNTVNVQIHSGSIATITRAQLLNGGNLAVLGDELVMFQRAELVATGIYKLSGLLRGRFGTQQHMGTHTATDRFVLFTPNVYRITDTLSNLNVPAQWKPVTLGQTTDDANAIDFTNTGAGLKPLSVVHLFAADDGLGNVDAKWIRRARGGVAWRDGADAPLMESSERYEVNLFDPSAALVATAFVTEPQWHYDGSTATPVPTYVTIESTFAYATRDVKIVGGDLIGIDKQSEDDDSTGSLHFVQFDTAGALIGISTDDIGAFCYQWEFSGDEIYLVSADFNAGSPTTFQNSFVHRLTRGDLNIQANYTAAVPGDFAGVACDGTDVWVSGYYSGNLMRFDASTLALLNTYSVDAGLCQLQVDGGSLWAINSVTRELIEWDIATTTELRRIPTAVSSWNFRIVGNLIFVSGVYVYNKTTGALVSTLANYIGAPIVEFDSYVAFSDSFLPGRLRLVDKTTGLLALTLNATLAGYYVDVVGSNDVDQLYVTAYGPTGTVIGSYVVELDAPPPVYADYSGYSVTVYQLSGSVGRGFPASVIIE